MGGIMSNTINDLKNDHVAFVNFLESIKSLGPEEQKKLLTLKKAFLDHLKKEDQYFYPALKKAAELDPALKSKLNMFADEMDKISAEVLAFFDRFEKGGTALEFAKDWGRLVFQLKTRMRREEDILHPEFQKLQK